MLLNPVLLRPPVFTKLSSVRAVKQPSAAKLSSVHSRSVPRVRPSNLDSLEIVWQAILGCTGIQLSVSVEEQVSSLGSSGTL